MRDFERKYPFHPASAFTCSCLLWRKDSLDAESAVRSSAFVLKNARQKGYRLACTEATGKISQHIFRKNGFTDRFTTSYADFLYDERAPFASIRHHGAAILLSRSIF